MNKQDYLNDLRKKLKGIPKEDLEDAIRYYDELMSDMDVSDSEDVSARLGSPKDVARSIIDETTVKYAEEVQNSHKIKNSGKVIWLTILGILSTPVSIPLAIALFAVSFVIFITLFAMYIAFFAAAIALCLGGLVTAGLAFIIPGVANKLAWCGLGVISAGLGLLLGYGLICLIKVVVKGIGRRKSQKKEKCNE